MPQKCSISAASVLYLFKSAAFHFQSIVSSFHVHIFKCFDSKRSPRSQIVPTRVQICSTLAQNICLYSDTNDATQMSCFFSFESFSCFCTLMKLLLNEINDQMKQNENSPNNTMQRWPEALALPHCGTRLLYFWQCPCHSYSFGPWSFLVCYGVVMKLDQ